MAHWSDAYMDRAWAEDYNCAALAVDVAETVFARSVVTPCITTGLRAGTRMIDAMRDDIAERVATPSDGDVALMRCGPLWHVGVACIISGRTWILHNLKSAGRVVRTMPRDLQSLGLELEGYYAWK